MLKCLFLTAVCEKIEEKRERKKKRMWMKDVFVSRCNEGEIHMLLGELRKDTVKHGQYLRKSTVSATKSSCLPFSRCRCDFGCHQEWR
jgi:hypothetical protein